MKLSNRIMSWVLSPGAYAVWHSLGNPEEWQYHHDSDYITHKTTQVRLIVPNEDTVDLPYTVAGPLAFLVGSFMLDCLEPFENSIGLFERHLIAGRAARVRNKLRKARDSRKQRNRALFSKLMVNE